MKPPLATLLVAFLAALFTGCSAHNVATEPTAMASVQQAGGVNTQATGFNYNTTLPAGAVIIVVFAMAGFWFQALFDRLTSHRREMARIKANLGSKADSGS